MDRRAGSPSERRPGPALDRRRFLASAGATAGALLVPGALGACSATTTGGAAPGTAAPPGTAPGTTLPPFGDPMLSVPAAQSPIKNIVVLMMENRSFDHWLGWLADDAGYLEAGRRTYGADFRIDGTQIQTFAGPSGPVTTAHLTESLADSNPFRGCNHSDPGHGWTQGRAQRDGGFLATGSGNDALAVGYYLDADVPFSAALAKRFVVCDRSFASVLGPTYPNREYLLSAQSGGNKSNKLPATGDGFMWDTIIDRLAKAGVSVGCYYVDLPVVALWGPRMVPYLHKIDDYFADAKAGTLPSVTFVDPGFNGGSRTDNHPHGDVHAGERFARDVFAAFARSPQWRSGTFFLTYDEWGGFFDHVAPPTFPDDRTSGDDLENFGQAGFRVPTVVASPYTKPGWVDHQTYDHTSILRFLEWRFLGAPPEGPGGSADWSLTARDRNANNIGAALVTKAQTDIGMDLDLVIDPPTPDCGTPAEGLGYTFDADADADADADDDGAATGAPPKHSFEEARDAGFFDAVGVDTEPSSMAREWVAR